MFLIPWYVTLCVAQGVLVMLPAVGRDSSSRRGALVGLVGPAAAMVVGVGLVTLLGGAGASILTWLGTIATPVLAGSLGWIARWRWPALTAVAAAGLYVAAWQASGRSAQIAAMLLIGGACLTIAGFVGPFTPARYLAIGIVGLVVLDTYLVFGTSQVAHTTVALNHATLPPISVGTGPAHIRFPDCSRSTSATPRWAGSTSWRRPCSAPSSAGRPGRGWSPGWWSRSQRCCSGCC